MDHIHLGTIGSGSIVRTILDHVLVTPGIHLEAVYSRSLKTGTALASDYGAAKIYTDLSELLADRAVNCIYIASPNSLHYAQAKAALLAGKHVICEKPFCPTAAQARELVQLAAEKDLMLVDATPTAYLPNLQVLKEQLPKLGRIRLVMGNYSQYSSRYDKLLQGEVTNVFDPAFAGGCLMDINYYNLYLNIALFGKPQAAEYIPNLWDNGIDTSGCLTLRYPDFVSTNLGAKDTWGENFFQIEGEQGYIYISGGSNGLDSIRLVTKTSDEIFTLQSDADRRSYEVRAITALLLQEDTAALHKLLQTNLTVIELLEAARTSAGIRFPTDAPTHRRSCPPYL